MILDSGRGSSLRATDPSLNEAPEHVSGKECRDDPLRVLPDAIQHLPSPRHNQYALFLTALPFLGMDGRRIEVTQVDASAPFFCDARSQRHLNARSLYPTALVVLA